MMVFRFRCRQLLICLIAVLLLLSQTGCSSYIFRFELLPTQTPSETPSSSPTTEHGEKEIYAEVYPFFNYTSEYEIADCDLLTYFVGNNSLPFVEVMDFLRTLQGFLKTDELTVEYCNEQDIMTLSWEYTEDEETMRISGHTEPETELLTMKIDAGTDTIWVSSLDFFGFVNDTLSTNYGEFLVLDHYDYEEGSDVTYPIGEYGFDIIFYEGKCLAPFCILNLLFCSGNGYMYNVYFNGEEYFGVWGCAEDEVLETIKSGSLENTECPEDIRTATVQFICFLMDYFYGLKEQKGYSSFAETLTDAEQKALLDSSPDIYTDAYSALFHGALQDLHTCILNTSIYNNANDTTSPYDVEDTESGWYQFIELYLRIYYSLMELYPEGVSPVRYEGNTAFIWLESFETGEQEALYDEEGNEKEDAILYDSCLYMRYCMKLIEAHGGIDNVVVDLSCNTGGNIGASITLLGFLTDEPISVSTYNRLNGEYVTEYYRIDTDGDGDTEGDAYTEYNWYIKTSGVTYSAANLFTAIADNMGIATIVGTRSGGGMCSVLYAVLPDGSSVQLSSDDALIVSVVKDGIREYIPTEDGIEPEIAIPDENYFDDAYLVKLINQK